MYMECVYSLCKLCKCMKCVHGMYTHSAENVHALHDSVHVQYKFDTHSMAHSTFMFNSPYTLPGTPQDETFNF